MFFFIFYSFYHILGGGYNGRFPNLKSIEKRQI